MSVYEEIQDLYSFDTVEEFNPELHITEITITDGTFRAYAFQTPSGLNVAAYRTEGTMGNHWSLYDINNSKHLIFGRKTRKQIIEEAGRL